MASSVKCPTENPQQSTHKGRSPGGPRPGLAAAEQLARTGSPATRPCLPTASRSPRLGRGSVPTAPLDGQAGTRSPELAAGISGLAGKTPVIAIAGVTSLGRSGPSTDSNPNLPRRLLSTSLLTHHLQMGTCVSEREGTSPRSHTELGFQPKWSGTKVHSCPVNPGLRTGQWGGGAHHEGWQGQHRSGRALALQKGPPLSHCAELCSLLPNIPVSLATGSFQSPPDKAVRGCPAPAPAWETQRERRGHMSAQEASGQGRWGHSGTRCHAVSPGCGGVNSHLHPARLTPLPRLSRHHSRKCWKPILSCFSR